MKLLMDISQKEYDTLKGFDEQGFGISSIEKAILNGVILPSNATNGNMMDALFDSDTRKSHVVCSREWLKMPYKEMKRKKEKKHGEKKA